MYRYLYLFDETKLSIKLLYTTITGDCLLAPITRLLTGPVVLSTLIDVPNVTISFDRTFLKIFDISLFNKTVYGLNHNPPYLSSIDANNASYNANTDSPFVSFRTNDTLTTTTADNDGNYATAPLTGIIASVQIDAGGSNYTVGDEIQVSGGGGSEGGKEVNIKSYSTTEAAMILDAAEKIIIVPGYGLAVAQAQHVAREVAESLEAMGKKVLYAIHPVAGRMPGHMNVLLAEANVSYDVLKDLDEINPEFEDCDVALILGANDVVNPAARHDQSSPIYGMPILNVDKSRTVIINKRSMNPGFAGVQNELFGYDNSIMVFGDAKDMLNDLLKEVKEL